MAKRIVIPLLLILIAGLSWWSHSLQKSTTTREISPFGPDFYLNEFRSVSMDTDGKPKEMLIAKQLKHFPIDDRTVLEQPQLTIIRSNDTRYIVTAKMGSLYSDDSLLLQGDVNIQRYVESKLATQVFTEELWVQSTEKRAHTQKPVKFVDQLGEINAVGIVADLGNHKVQLLHRVRGKYYASP